MSQALIHIKDAVKKSTERMLSRAGFESLSIREESSLLCLLGAANNIKLRMIAGFNSIEGGDFYFNERRINSDPCQAQYRYGVPELRDLLPHLNVRKMEFGLRTSSLKIRSLHRRTSLCSSCRSTSLAIAAPERLSGGTAAACAGARALLHRAGCSVDGQPPF